MDQQKREELARQAETIFNRVAGVVRNLIIEGMDIDEATENERVTYWSDQIEAIQNQLKI